MLFSTPLFLFLFFPLFLAVYISFGRLRNFTAAIFSAIFYLWGEPKFALIVFASLGVDWGLGNLIHRQRVGGHAPKGFLALGVVLNVGLLVFYKYTGFFLTNVNHLASIFNFDPIPVLRVALPLGVSFIVFEKITYLVDIYRRESEPARSVLLYAEYILLFPKLLAGPIVKYHDIRHQLEVRNVTMDDLSAGLQRFIIGLAKKTLLADRLSPVADQVFNMPASTLTTVSAWLGVLAFTFQIYFDFSGYSDMAIGLARMMGFRLMENFNLPYVSQSFTEFWRRWHISLSTWIKSYLYIPLGGNRVPAHRMYFNLVFCFLVSGLWHGASWTFVVWGLMHGFFLVVDKVIWFRVSSHIPKALNGLATFLLIMLTWVIFRSRSIDQALHFLGAMFGGGEEQVVYPGNVLLWSKSFRFVLGVSALVSVLPHFLKDFKFKYFSSNLWWYACCLLLFVLSLVSISASQFIPFIYFRF